MILPTSQRAPGPQAATRLIIVDQGLRDLCGHHAEYSLSVAAEAARRVPVIVLAHSRCAIGEVPGVAIRPVFRYEWTRPQRANIAAHPDPSAHFDPRLFLDDLRFGLAGVGATRDDCVFIHTIGFGEIEDLLALAMIAGPSRLPLLQILLRRDLDEIEGPNARGRFAAHVRAFAQLGYWPDRVRFYADTDELGDQYASATGVPFATLPIPFGEDALRREVEAQDRSGRKGPLVIGYLGDARTEKGYQFLPSVADALAERHLKPGRARLRIQSNFYFAGGEPGMAEARQALEGWGRDLVELRYEPLPAAEYYRDLAGADIVVLPYVAERYRRRSSGIFAQAIAAGKIIVVPHATTMWAQAQRLGIGSCLGYGSPDELPLAVAEAVDRHHSLAPTARAARERRLAQSSTVGLVDAILAPAAAWPLEAASRRDGPLVLLVRGGPNPYRRAGTASDRTLPEGLHDCGCRVVVLNLVAANANATDLFAWLARNEAYWLNTGIAFSWLSCFVQPGRASPAALDTELANAELLSLPDTLRSVLAATSIDLVWLDSVAAAPILEPLLLQDRALVIECGELRSLDFALRRRSAIDAGELAAELAILAGADAIVPDETIAALCAAGEGRPPLAAFTRANVADGGQSSPPADLLFVVGADDCDIAASRWFCETVYQPHLQPLGITLSLAGPTLDGAETAKARGLWPEAASFLLGPVLATTQAFAAAAVVILPIHGDDGRLSDAADCRLPSCVALADDAAGFAAQLATLVATRRRQEEPAGETQAASAARLVEQVLRKIGRHAAVGRDAGERERPPAAPTPALAAVEVSPQSAAPGQTAPQPRPAPRNRPVDRPHVLFIDHEIPRWDRDAGSRCIDHYVRLFGSQGFDVSFWPESASGDRKYSQDLQRLGVEIIDSAGGLAGLAAWIGRDGQRLDYVFLSRPHTASLHLDLLRTSVAAPLLYFGHDIHWLRHEAEHAVTGDVEALVEARSMRRMEEAVWRRVDLVLYPTRQECDVVRALVPEVEVGEIPLFIYDEAIGTGLSRPAAVGGGRDGFELLFVGGFAHAPNADGICWFVRDIFPRICAQDPRFRLTIVGADPPAAVRAFETPRITVAGYLDEAELARRYAAAGAVVVPLRFGAGMKGKVVEAFAHDAPVVSTRVGMQGFPDGDRLAGVADDPAGFAAQVIALCTDAGLAKAKTGYAREIIGQRFSLDAARGALAEQIVEFRR